MGIENKVFVVTGGGNGIGREVVLELLRRGSKVAAVDLSDDGLAETARLADAGDRLTTHPLSVTDRGAVEALPDAVTAAHGAVDGLVNVAGIIQQFVPVADLSYEEIGRVMDVNFWGVVIMTKTFLPVLLSRPHASLVNVSSMGALVPVPGQSAYGASKAAVKLFTEGLQAELRETGVAVTVVFPGGVATNISGNSGVEMPGGEEAAKAAAAESKMVMTTAPDAARQIVDAVATGKPRVLIGKDAQMLDKLSRLMPTKAIEIIAKKMKELLG